MGRYGEVWRRYWETWFEHGLVLRAATVAIDAHAGARLRVGGHQRQGDHVLHVGGGEALVRFRVRVRARACRRIRSKP